MVKSSFFWFAFAAFLLLGVGLFVTWLQWDWLRGGGSEPASNGDTLRNAGLMLGGIIALVFALWRGWVAQQQSTAAQRQADISQQGMLNERYERGTEMLGSTVLSVRLGGIYGLASLAEDHPDQYHAPIFQLLCTFVRRPPEEGKSDDKHELRQDVQAAMTAICGRSEAGIGHEKATRGFLLEETASVEEGVTVRRKGLFWLDLSGANLRSVDLLEARLSRANFRDADLSNSTLMEANLSHAILWRANLSHARLWKANLSKADISQGATLSNADLTYANLVDSNLFLADLSGASLLGANLSGASLERTNLTGAVLSEVTGLEQYSLDQGSRRP